MKTTDHSTAAVALACNRARLVRIALTRRTPCWPHPLQFQAEPALKQAWKADAQALAHCLARLVRWCWTCVPRR